MHGLEPIADRVVDAGPIAGLEALAGVCRTPWLLTLPVDVIGVNECLLASLVSAARGHGAFAIDDDGVQPLVALWSAPRLREWRIGCDRTWRPFGAGAAATAGDGRSALRRRPLRQSQYAR